MFPSFYHHYLGTPASNNLRGFYDVVGLCELPGFGFVNNERVAPGNRLNESITVTFNPKIIDVLIILLGTNDTKRKF